MGGNSLDILNFSGVRQDYAVSRFDINQNTFHQ